MPRIVIIVGEASGDLLGRGLIAELRKRYPDAVIEGITGPDMRAAGCVSWGDYEQLAVMGIFEVVRHLPRLYRLFRDLQRRLRDDPPDLLIGIDAPDFNLRLEKFARGIGIPTVHYVCPSVWAWRQGRVKAIRESCDLVLCLLPFEQGFLAEHGVAAKFVGHPMADEISPVAASAEHRQALGLPDTPLVAILPGSRAGEVSRLGPPFLEAVYWMRERRPELQFILAAASGTTETLLRAQLRDAGLEHDVKIVTGKTRAAISAADVVLLASGTATLETMLLMRPMVVAYRISPLTIWLLRKSGLVKIKRFSMPNLLSDSDLVPEFIQEAVTAPNLGAAVLDQLTPGQSHEALLREFARQGERLRKSASAEAAAAVAGLLDSRIGRAQGTTG